MLIACKCTPFCKKLDYDAKSEPLYLATTQKHLELIHKAWVPSIHNFQIPKKRFLEQEYMHLF